MTTQELVAAIEAAVAQATFPEWVHKVEVSTEVDEDGDGSVYLDLHYITPDDLREGFDPMTAWGNFKEPVQVHDGLSDGYEDQWGDWIVCERAEWHIRGGRLAD